MAIRHDALCSRSGSRSAFIGNKIGNRKIGLMPHSTHNGNLARSHGARHHLFIECPQVFDTAATATHDQHFTFRTLISQPDGLSDLFRTASALNRGWIKYYWYTRQALAQNSKHISKRGSLWRGDYANASRK